MKVRLVSSLLGVLLAVGSSPAVWAADEPPHVRIVWTDEAPTIDGRLDDPVWEKAATIEDFVQVLPETGDDD